MLCSPRHCFRRGLWPICHLWIVDVWRWTIARYIDLSDWFAMQPLVWAFLKWKFPNKSVDVRTCHALNHFVESVERAFNHIKGKLKTIFVECFQWERKFWILARDRFLRLSLNLSLEHSVDRNKYRFGGLVRWRRTAHQNHKSVWGETLTSFSSAHVCGAEQCYCLSMPCTSTYRKYSNGEMTFTWMFSIIALNVFHSKCSRCNWGCWPIIIRMRVKVRFDCITRRLMMVLANSNRSNALQIHRAQSECYQFRSLPASHWTHPAYLLPAVQS